MVAAHPADKTARPLRPEREFPDISLPFDCHGDKHRTDFVDAVSVRSCQAGDADADVRPGQAADMLREYFTEPEIRCFNTGANLGGAGGFSFGMRKAVELGYSYIWAMDDDTYAEPNALEELLKADRALKGNYGFLSGLAFWIDGSVCSMNRQHTSLRGRITGDEQSLTSVLMATFVSFFIKTETVCNFGLPIRDFVIWSDDLEYSRRISRELPCYAVPASRVIHAMASNQKVGIENDLPERLWRYEKLYRNEVYVYRREGLRGLLFLLLRVNLHRARVLLYAKDMKREKLRVIGRSLRSGFRFHPTIEYVDGDQP